VFHLSATLLLLLSDELVSWCAVGTSEWLDLRRRAFPLDGQVSAEWSRCPASMAQHARESVAPLQCSSAGWIPMRKGRFLLVQDEGISHSLQGVVDRRVSEAGMSTAAPDRSTLLCC